MSLLQDPKKALDQAEWFLDHRQYEKFPGAFELAAGNLCRQTLEQILFILCFFSRMPKNCFIKTDRTLQTAGLLLRELDKIDPTTRKSYWAIARVRGPRIRKFARYPRTLKIWWKKLSEPSHFSAKFRKVNEAGIREFIHQARGWLDDEDKLLIVAAINEIFSNGKVLATLANDKDNTPGIKWNVVVDPSNLYCAEDGRLALRTPYMGFKVISDTEIPRGRWPQLPVIVKGWGNFDFGFQFYNKQGDPIDLTNLKTVFKSFAKTKSDRNYLIKCLRQLGFKVNVKTSIER